MKIKGVFEKFENFWKQDWHEEPTLENLRNLGL